MKLWIVLYREDGGELRLDSAWDEAARAADPEVARRQAEVVVQQPGITESHWRVIDVPDDLMTEPLSGSLHVVVNTETMEQPHPHAQ